MSPNLAARCLCACHLSPEALLEFGRTVGPSAERTDPVAAVTACATCRGAHAVVFSGRPPELDARPWNPKPLEAAAPVPDAPC